MSGERENFMPTVNGRTFRCTWCGCNVFHKDEPTIYVCNGCGDRYEATGKIEGDDDARPDE